MLTVCRAVQLRWPLRITPSGTLVQAALELATRTRRTVCDCPYLTLAVKTGSVMCTSEKRLVNALADGPLNKHVAWIGALDENQGRARSYRKTTSPSL